MPGAFSHVTVGVASLAEACRFWDGHFGFGITAQRDGADAALAALWDLRPGDITRQALLRSPPGHCGALHLVEFAHPAAPVRAGAAVFDQLPKNLDIYASDLPRRWAELAGAGVVFRSDPVTSPGPDGLVFREAHLHGPDETNVVLIEVLGEDYGVRYNGKGFSGIGPLVCVVPDLGRETAFFREMLGLESTLEARLTGAIVERSIGLPAGSALALTVLGDPREPLGRIELIEYEGCQGSNRFAQARAPALGTLHITYRTANCGPLVARLLRAGITVTEHGNRDLIYGSGRLVSFHSPAGLRIEVQAER